MEYTLNLHTIANDYTGDNIWHKCFSIPATDNYMVGFKVISGFNNADTQYADIIIVKSSSNLHIRTLETIGSTEVQAKSSNYVVTLDNNVLTFYAYKRHRYTTLFASVYRYGSYGGNSGYPQITWINTVTTDPSLGTHENIQIATLIAYRNVTE